MRTLPVVIPATDEHAVAMAPHLRMVDCTEMLTGDPLATIREGLQASTHAWTWLVDDRPACMWGLVPKALIGDTAYIWVMTTDQVALDRRTFWQGSKVMLEMIRGLYPVIEGFVDARFTQSVRWLTRLGIQLKDPVLVHGVPLRHFETR